MQSNYIANFPHAELSSQDESSKITLCAYSYEFPQVTSGWDADWLKVYFHLCIPGFQIEMDEPMLDVASLKKFADELQALSELRCNAAELFPIEPYILLNLSLSRQKKVIVDGTVCNMSRQNDAKLKFSFMTDLTYIDAFAKGLQEILEKFPPRK